MGKVIKHKIQGMSWWMKTSLVLLLTLTTMVFMYEGWYKPKQILAAVASQQTFVAHTSGNNFTVNAGTNRLLVVAVAGQLSGGGAALTASASYGGTAMTLVTGDAATSSRSHTYLFVANDTVIGAGAQTKALTVTLGAGATTSQVTAAVFNGVNQTTPVVTTDSTKFGNAVGTTDGTTIALTTPGLNIASGEIAVAIEGNYNNGTTASPTITTPTGWTLGLNSTATAASSSVFSRSTANASDLVSMTIAPTSRRSLSAIVLNPSVSTGNLSIGDTAVSSASVAQASTDNELNGFTMFMSSGSGTVNTLTLTGTAQFTNANVTAVRLYRDNGTTGVYEAGTDVLVPTTTAWASNVATLTITTPEAVSTTSVNYLVVVDVAAGATVGNTLGGTISAATGSNLGTVTDNDSATATLTVTAGAGFNVANGTNPVSANASRGSTNNALDGFTLQMTSGTGSITNFTVTGSANFTATNIPTNGVKIYRDAGTIGVLDGADTLISSASTAIATNATTVTLSAAETVTTTAANYLVVVDVNAAATLAQAFTGTVTAATGTGYVSSSFADSGSGTLTVTAAQTLTVANGTNPANANINTGGTAALDAFTMAVNAGSATVNTLTLTGSANFTTANITSAAVYADNGTVGTYESGTDTPIATTYSQVGTIGTITFTAPETVTTTAKNYLVLVTASGAATVSQTFTGTITAATGTGIGTPSYTDTASATLTIASGPVATIGTCGGCHFYTGITGNLPQDGTARNTPVGQFLGSHGQHSGVTYGYACSVCHVVPATSTTVDNKHSNGTLNMAIPINANTNAAYGKGTSWAIANPPSAFQSCNATICHGQKSPVWGVVGNTVSPCYKCHGLKSAAAFTTFSAANIAPGGSGVDTSGTNTTGARVGLHQNHMTAPTAISNPMRCGECHTTVTSVTQATHMRYTTARPTWGPVATNTYGNAADSTKPKKTPTVTRVGLVMQCSNTECHTGTRPAGTLAMQAGAGGSSSVVPSFNDTTLLGGTSLLDTCINKCHGLPPGAGVVGDSHEGLTGTYTTIASLAACNGCHSHINAAPTTMANIFTDKSLHINGVADASGGSCLACHNGLKGTAPNQRAAVVTQFNNGTLVGGSHHVQGVALANTHCYQCHMEANSDGTINSVYHGGQTKPGSAVNLVVYGAGTRGAAFVSYTAANAKISVAQARSSYAKITNHCLGCHSTANNAIQPYADGKTPNQYAWDSTKTSIQARYSQTATVPWLPVNYSTATNMANRKTTVTKALSAHGNAANNKRGFKHNVALAAKEDWSNTSGAAKVECFDCHNSHGSSVTGKTTSYTSATDVGGMLKDVVSGQGGYSVTYKAYSGGSVAAPFKNKFNAGAGLCFDCHNSLNSGVTTKITNGTTFTSPWGYSETFGSTQAIYGYNDTPYFSAGTSGSQVRYAYKGQGTSSVNKGGHFGASSTLNVTTTTKIDGICTRCHDPHGVTTDTTKVSNSAYGVPLLKGTWMTSPYREDATPNSTTEKRGGGERTAFMSLGSTPNYFLDQNTFGAKTFRTQENATAGDLAAQSWTFTQPASKVTEASGVFGGLCMQTGCHVQASINTAGAANSTNWRTLTRVHNAVSGWAGTGGGNAANAMHAYTCSKCHAPHKSNLPRLLISNCLDYSHRGRVTSGATVGTVAGSAAANTGNLTRSGSRGRGNGRFPGGGGRYYQTDTKPSFPGPWFFGKMLGGTANANTATLRPCHDSATAGGAYATDYPNSQRWNTKSPW